MTSPSLIYVEHLFRDFGLRQVLRDISFEVDRGQILGFLGPNGAGKSTTMNILAGNLAPGSGRVLINGIDILAEPIRAKKNIGYLPEHPPLYPELTVNEYLQFCARLRGMNRTDARQAVTRAKQRCGLAEVGGRLIRNLSKGYQQRTGIAQAIIHSPEVVILDEPTVGLDPIQIRSIRALIGELGEEHSVILSTHILPEVQAVCSHVQIIHQGQLQLHTSIDQLAHHLHGQSLLVAFNRPPGIDRLASLAGVNAVQPLEEGSFSLKIDDMSDPTDELVSLAVHENWGLRMLVPQQASLEEIFMGLTDDSEPVASPLEESAPSAAEQAHLEQEETKGG